MAIVQVAHRGHEDGLVLPGQRAAQLGDGVNDLHGPRDQYPWTASSGKLPSLIAATYAATASATDKPGASAALPGTRVKSRTKRGREHCCRLEHARLKEAEAWIEDHRRFWNERLDALEPYLKENP